MLLQSTGFMHRVVHPCRPVVEHPTRILRPTINLDRAIFEQDVLDRDLRMSIDSEAIFRNTAHVLESYVAQQACLPILRSRPNRDRGGLAPTPPAGSVVLRKKVDIAKFDVFDVAGLPMSDRRATASGHDAATLEENFRDVPERFCADLDATIAADNGAISHDDVVHYSIVFAGLITGLEDDAIVRANNVAVLDLHIAATVWIYRVAVRNVEIITNPNAIDEDMLAAKCMETPLRRVPEGDTGDLKTSATDEMKHFWPEGERLPAFMHGRVVAHEFHTLSVDVSGTRDAHVAGSVGVDDPVVPLECVMHSFRACKKDCVIRETENVSALFKPPESLLFPLHS